MDIVKSFIDNYIQKLDFYQNVSQLCAQQCEAGLESMGIKAIVTYRAKRPDKLEEKITKRFSKGKKYKSEKDIDKDIIDLAGVRIALYFPGDRAETAKFIESAFDNVKPPKSFPESSERDENNKYKFSGYSATHYYVRLRSNKVSPSQQRYTNTTVEIQIASVLMHAWSEVEHDLVYKPLHGTIYEEELAMLDQLNGLVLSGEIALESLQKAIKRRVGEKTRKFNNHYELASYLLEITKNDQEVSTIEPIVGAVDILYKFLVKAEMNRPDKVVQYVKAIQTVTEQRPIAQQIIDAILADKPTEYYKIYEDIRNEKSNKTGYAIGKDVTFKTEDRNYFSSFIRKWVELEVSIKDLVNSNTDKKPKFYVMIHRYAFENKLIDENIYNDIETIRKYRNSIVHGIEQPNANSLINNTIKLDNIIKIINNKLG